MMLIPAAAAWLHGWWRSRRIPVEVFRDRCPVCGHVEDSPNARIALVRMGHHIVTAHDPVGRPV